MLRCLLSLIFISSYAIADIDVGRNHLLLKEVDELASTDLAQSKKIFQKIEVDKLSKEDKELYSYMSSYFIATSGKLNQAIPPLKTLTEKEVAQKVRVMAQSLLLLIYAGIYEWELGLKTLNDLSLELEEGIDKKFKISAIANMINFYNLVGEHLLAKKLAEKSISDVATLSQQCRIKSQYLYANYMLGTITQTRSSFIEVIDLCKSSNSIFNVQATYFYLAEHLNKNSQYLEAEQILLENLPSVEETGYQTMAASYHSLLAEIYLNTKDFTNAKYFAQKIINSHEHHQSAESIADAYKVLSSTNGHLKMFEEAYSYYKQYSEANQNKLKENNAKLLAIHKAKLDIIEKNNQINLLDKENALLRTQALLAQKSTQNRQLLLALLAIVLVILMLWIYKNRRTYIQIKKVAETDQLTGIANRHHFSKLATSTISFCKKTQQPVSFVLFDLDFFKSINDTYGHQVGDKALAMAVAAAKRACRKNDIIGRLGGEEFGIILPGCGNHLASHIAEKCRRELARIDSSQTGHDFTLTASFGVADSVACGYDFDKLFAGADNALYQSKHLGRDRVFSYQLQAADLTS